MSPIPEPQTVNRFPGCVAMKLHLDAESVPTPDTSPDLDPFATPSQPDTGNSKSPYPPLTLSLTINFSGEQEIDIPGARALGIPSGKATFGVRRCDLRFTLVNCRLPLDQVTLCAPLKHSVTVETQREQATETQAGITLGGTVGEKPSGTGSGTLGFKQSGKTVEKVTTERFQIHYSGDEATPMWVFEVKGGDVILQGSLNRNKLGTVTITVPRLTPQTTRLGETRFRLKRLSVLSLLDYPSLTAVVLVRPEDVYLTWGKVAWTRNITRNKLAAIECAIALRHIAPKLEDGLSMTEWQYGGH